MRQKFFTKTIQSDFIKSLLYNTPLPTYNTVRVGDYIIKGHTYILDRNIIKCKKSGYICNDIKVLEEWNTESATLGNFKLGVDVLGITTSIPIVTSGAQLQENKYYLLAEYNLRYNLNETDPDYPYFSSSQSYLTNDIVQYYINNAYYLYKAKENISAGHSWNSEQWSFISAYTRPYILIKCTESGRLGELPLGASYMILQNFEPEVISEFSTEKLDRYTYYLRIAIVEENGANVTKLQLIYNENLYYLNQTAAKWSTYNTYIPETYYTKFSNRFISNSDYYDSQTHRRLGKLLRFYRDIYQVDLMAYYNCWNGEYLNNYQIYENELTKINYVAYKVIKVPIKFNKEYTIAIESSSQVKLIPAFVKNNEFLYVKVGNSNNFNLNSLLGNDIVQSYTSLQFNNPITFIIANDSTELLSDAEESVENSTLLKSEFLQRYEDNLYLIIQLPKDNNSSIVVLEGNYLYNNSDKIFNSENLKQIRTDELNSLLSNNLSLLWLNDNNTYPFSDRLIEYLLYNVITEMDTIGEDIIRVRQKLSQNGYLDYNMNDVAWDDNLRILLFKLYQTYNKNNKFDISGYVDKDIEYYVNNL